MQRSHWKQRKGSKTALVDEDGGEEWKGNEEDEKKNRREGYKRWTGEER